MKRIVLILLTLCLWISFGTAQPSQQIVISPQHPTEQDTIYAYVNLLFSQEGCKLKSKSLTESSFVVNSFAEHCEGDLNSFCEIIDTFKIPPKIAGSYLFTNEVITYKTQCLDPLPYISHDTLSFTVYDWGVGVEKPVLEVFSLYPNPATTHLTLEKVGAVKQEAVHTCTIYDALGRAIRKEEIIAFPTQIKIADFPAGIYWLQLTEDADFHSLPFIKE